METKIICITICAYLIFFVGCTKTEEIPGIIEPAGPQSTWEVIQSQIFEPNCVACHSSGTTFAKESDLILTKEEGYKQLVGRDPNNNEARKDGYLLVGIEGVASLEKSFLWEKINTPAFEHFYNDHPNYGSLMPLGSKSLTNGELEYIRKWILQGAPEKGYVADTLLLQDKTRFDQSDYDFFPLEPPSSGVQFHLDPFIVYPQNEREFLFYWPLENKEPLFANRFEVTMKRGSHHFLFYKYPEEAKKPEAFVYRDFRDANGNDNYETLISALNQIFVWGTQIPKTDYKLPDGVALKIEANQGFDINAHYVNYSNEPYTGEIYANVHTIPESEVKHVADNLFLNNTQFQLPPGKETTISKTYSFDEPKNIINLWSHAHKRMTEFKVFIKGGARNGELVYYTNDWEHPPLIEFDPVLRLNSGEGLTLQATYFNETAEMKSFGLLSEDEMMILFGLFY